MSYEADTIQKCANRIADDLELRLEHWSDVVFQEGRDGRELLIACRDLFIRALKSAGGTRQHAHAMIDGYDKHISGESKIMRQTSLLVSPNGRPLHKLP